MRALWFKESKINFQIWMPKPHARPSRREGDRQWQTELDYQPGASKGMSLRYVSWKFSVNLLHTLPLHDLWPTFPLESRRYQNPTHNGKFEINVTCLNSVLDLHWLQASSKWWTPWVHVFHWSEAIAFPSWSLRSHKFPKKNPCLPWPTPGSSWHWTPRRLYWYLSWQGPDMVICKSFMGCGISKFVIIQFLFEDLDRSCSARGETISSRT